MHLVDPDRQSSPSIPRWVKVSGIIAILVVLVMVIVLLVSGGEHGPRRHLPRGGMPAGHTPPVEHES